MPAIIKAEDTFRPGTVVDAGAALLVAGRGASYPTTKRSSTKAMENEHRNE